MDQVCLKMAVSERRACQVLSQARTTQRRELSPSSDELQLTKDIIELATKYGRYGYRRITALLNSNKYGWRVNHKRVEKIWRREGLKVPQKQPKRGRLWLNDGSCIRLRPERKDHVWSYDFVKEHTENGKAFRVLNIIDEYTKECLAALVDRKIRSDDVLDQLFNLFVFRGVPETHPLGQRARVYSQGRQEMASTGRSEDTVYRARQPLGKRLYRILQWEDER